MNQSLEEDKRRPRNRENKIAQIRQRLRVLEGEKRSLEVGISKRRFALEIWLSIPTEVWEIIFTIVCTAKPKNRRDYRPRIKPALKVPAVVLSHVCFRWRTIVLGSPRLWTNIYIVHIVLDKLPRGVHHLLRLVIKRSKGWPLDFYLSSDIYGQSDHAFALWELLLESSPRWKSIIFGQI
ncbi:hypothetical protein L218DRAFT_883881, partial [Marasmius fiardii PR-910]